MRLAVEYDKYLWPSKDPDTITDYGVDLSDEIPEGDSITSSTWTATAPVTHSGVMNNGRSCSALLAGGVAGQVYPVQIRANTTQGRTVDRMMRLPVEQKKG